MLFYPNDKLTNKLRSKLPIDIKAIDGPTVTCETMLTETWEDVQLWSKQGFLGVEMEAAMIFALSAFFKVPSVAVLTVGDNLIKEETMFHDNHGKQKEVRVKARNIQYQLALSELLDDIV